MALTTPSSIVLLSTIPTDEWELFEGTTERTESGWDVARARYVRDVGAIHVNGQGVEGAFPIGASMPGFANFWVVRAAVSCLGGSIWAWDVTGHGLAADRPLKINVRAAAEQQGASNVFVPGLPDPVKASALQSAPVIECEYIQIGGELPTVAVGTAGTPPVEVSVRPNIWTSLTDPTVHEPYEWVLMDLPTDQIPGQPVWLIKESWQYIFRYSP